VAADDCPPDPSMIDFLMRRCAQGLAKVTSSRSKREKTQYLVALDWRVSPECLSDKFDIIRAGVEVLVGEVKADP
jgi:hypothetical protein